VRAVFDALRVESLAPPLDTVHFRVSYPAAEPNPEADPTLGLVKPDPHQLPLPVVVIHPNFNCGQELYLWLAHGLAVAGFAAVTFDFVGPMIGGRPGLSTGIDLDAVSPGKLGVGDPHLFLDLLLARLAKNPELQGALDLDMVVLGGHSAGGTLSLLSADPARHPEVRGAFSYSGHARAQVPQGFGPDAYLPLPGGVPLLLMGGTDDGVVSAIAQQQTGEVLPGHPMEHTFRRSVPAGCDALLVLVEGANHYAFAAGYDGSSGRGYLEAPGSLDDDRVREALQPVVVAFCQAVTGAGDRRRELEDIAARGIGVPGRVELRG